MRGHLLFAALLIAISSIGCAQAATIYVPDNYTKIQWAVDNASAGDTIIVRDGNYYENVVVDKQLTIKSENGSENCIVNGSGGALGKENVFRLEADGIRIEGFTITGGFTGIHIWYSNNNSISNNSVSNNYYGIYLYKSNNNSISNNIISSNGDGIGLGDSNENSISKNNISLNNRHGIFLSGSNNNSISKNNISSNNWYGIYPSCSNNNIIYLNNFIKNTKNTCSFYSINIWNSTEKITYTYKGSTFTNYTGNYWDNYNGSDANGDGIGDTPYSIDSDKDYYPLMERFENYSAPAPTPTPTPTPIPEFPAYLLLIAASSMIALAFMISMRRGKK